MKILKIIMGTVFKAMGKNLKMEIEYGSWKSI
jgi:hypothetical protein